MKTNNIQIQFKKGVNTEYQLLSEIYIAKYLYDSKLIIVRHELLWDFLKGYSIKISIKTNNIQTQF